MVQKKVPSMHGISIVHKLLRRQIFYLAALIVIAIAGIGHCYAQKKIDEAYLKCQYDYTYVVERLLRGFRLLGKGQPYPEGRFGKATGRTGRKNN